ncbi:MAG: stage III sporulation protein AB [Lachnospiraceae bacterium]|nr:stage III sporulation protein AB [Lachnospiraceae bacterium]
MRAMLKLCGLLCVFGACSLAGIEMDHSLKRRWLFLLEMKDALLLLEQEMTWYRTPLWEALKSAADVCKTPLRPMLLCCAGQVEARGGQSFQEIWRESIEKNLPKELIWNTAEHQLLLETAGAFTSTDIGLQKICLQKFQQRFDKMSALAYQEWQEKGTLWRRLSAASGAAAVIILL